MNKPVKPGDKVKAALMGKELTGTVVTVYPKRPYEKAWATVRATPRPEWFPYDGTDLFASDICDLEVQP